MNKIEQRRIEQQWAQVKPRTWGKNMHSGEREMLCSLLEPYENIECLLGGKFGPDLGHARPLRDTLHSGIVVATNIRVLFVDKGIFSTEVAEIQYGSIEAITYSSGLTFAGLRITGRGTMSFRVEMVRPEEVRPFVRCVRTHLDDPGPQWATTPAQSTAADEIYRLTFLLERHEITVEEFDNRKRQLLALQEE